MSRNTKEIIGIILGGMVFVDIAIALAFAGAYLAE